MYHLTYLILKKRCNFEIRVSGHSKSSKLVPFNCLPIVVSY